MLVLLSGHNSPHLQSMSGYPHRRNLQHQDDLQDLANESNQRLPASARRSASGAPVHPSSSSNSQENFLSSQDLMTASLSPSTRNPSYLQGSGAMTTWQDQLDAARTSSLVARMAQAQRAQQQQQAAAAQFHLQQQQQQQQAAAAAQQGEFELNSLLLQKRHIDEMLLNSAYNARRLSMESGLPPGLYGGAAGRLPGQAATSLPLSMSASAASMLGNTPGMGSSRNVSNHPLMGEPDLLSGKIRALEGRGSALAWAEQSRRLSDPHHSHVGMGLMPSAGIPRGAGMGVTSQPGYDDEAGYQEEEDEVYFDDAGTDEVDRDFKRSQENFPLKLYRIIYEVTKSGRGDVISFFPHGRAFAVHKPKEFINEIMPKYFATGRMNTFLKQLNLYGFRRITEGRDKGGYFHPKFILGKRHLCKVIKRKKTDSKPAASKSAPKSSPESKQTETSPPSAEEYAKSLSQQMRKQR